jgi:uncharacterized protein
LAQFTYGQFGREHFEKIQPGIKLFNDGYYWECHEELEDLWLDDRGDDARLVYWVIIQVATSLYHFQNSNRVGAMGMLEKSLDKLRRMEGKHVETSWLEKIGWSTFVGLVLEASRKKDDESFDKLRKYKFNLEVGL